MANPISGVSGVQQVAQAEAPAQPAKQPAKTSAIPTDTVTISAAGKAASQTQPVAGNSNSSGQSHQGHAKK